MTLTNFIYALLAGILPAFIWLWFWLREDREHSEPRWLLILAFVGGLVTVVPAIFGEKFVSEIFTDPTLHIVWAAIEEILKLAAVALIALHTSFNDEPIDAMIYCIVVAVGFSALENALFILGPLSHGQVAQGLVTENMRFIGATLIHIVCSAVIGFSLGATFWKSHLAKFLAVIAGLVVAIGLHSAFNLTIMNIEKADALRMFGWVWVAVVVLLMLFEEIKAVKPRTL